MPKLSAFSEWYTVDFGLDRPSLAFLQSLFGQLLRLGCMEGYRHLDHRNDIVQHEQRAVGNQHQKYLACPN
jgi:hypothetical protein